jgi:mono/diheme cytochrome c family protein
MIVVPLSVYCYFVSGAVPVATSAPPMPLERMLAKKALNARMVKEMPGSVPIQADEPNLAAGAKIYAGHCAVCHGRPGMPEGPIAKGMFPHPPRLMEGKGVTDDEPGETYWKVANGIRLTGMPSFHQSLSETEIWQVSLLAARADKLPQAAKDEIAAKGVTYVPSAYADPYPITRHLIEEGRAHLLEGHPFDPGCPVRILQGMRDPDVPWRHAVALVDLLDGADVELTLIKEGDHRLSAPGDLERLTATIATLVLRAR